jgi:hypothetical protein
MSNEAPKIYVACLASYNNGILHGKWIDAVQLVFKPFISRHEFAIRLLSSILIVN